MEKFEKYCPLGSLITLYCTTMSGKRKKANSCNSITMDRYLIIFRKFHNNIIIYISKYHYIILLYF